MAFPTIQELFDLTGQVALVTGGARGLGFDMTTALAEADADVAITSCNMESARASAIQITQSTGHQVSGFACDVHSEDQVMSMVDAVLAEFGKIDVLVNSAGNVVSTPEKSPSNSVRSKGGSLQSRKGSSHSKSCWPRSLPYPKLQTKPSSARQPTKTCFGRTCPDRIRAS